MLKITRGSTEMRVIYTNHMIIQMRTYIVETTSMVRSTFNRTIKRQQTTTMDYKAQPLPQTKPKYGNI